MTGKHDNRRLEFRDTVISYMRSLLSRRDFAGAVQQYEANSPLLDGAGEPAAAETLLQVSNAYASLTNYPAALKTARKAQSTASKQGDTNLLAEIFLKLGDILRNLGQVKEARKAFQDSESIFRRNDNPEGQCRALNSLAGLLYNLADYRNSLRTLMDAVEIARRLGDKQKLAFMMGNIGRLNTFIGDLAEADKHLQLNFDLSTELGDTKEAARACLSQAYVRMLMADYGATEQLLDKCSPMIVALGSKRDEAIYLSYLGELQMRTGRFDEAKGTLLRALEIAQGISPESTMAGRVLRLLAELAVQTGQFRRGQKLASQGMLIAEKAGNKVEIGALLRVKAQLAEGLGSASARDLYKRAIDQLDESGVRFERAEALVAAGRSTLFDHRTRMTCLFRAEEYYSRTRNHRRMDEVSRLIGKLEVARAESGTASLKSVDKGSDEHDYLTVCPEIVRIKSHLPKLGRPDLPILLTGETGVGKDHMARYFHSLVRPKGPYVAINCASVPETLLESELFGYVRGAFTGADGTKPGLFVAADGGVLLLDEIGDMPVSLQAKLLGVLERRKVIPLGSTRETEIDIVLVAATNKNLEQMVEEGLFRRDLYYRLSGVAFRLPPLRERKEDIPLLLRHFLVKRGMISEHVSPPAELVRQFLAHPWPGNIRELDNKIKRLQIMADLVAEGDLVEISRSLFDSAADQADAHENASLFDRVEQFERKLITEALLATDGNKSQAARLLGVHEATVRTKLKRYGIALPGIEPEENAPEQMIQ